MKRVLVFGFTNNYGGVEAIIMNYMRNMHREKINFDILCVYNKIAYEDELKKMGVNIYRITSRRTNYLKYKLELKNFFKSNAKKYDIFWCNVCNLINIDYIKYSKKYGIKTRIVHAHNSKNMSSKIKGLIHKVNKNLIKFYATNFWSCSDEASTYFYSNKIINSNKYRIINNAIDTEKYLFNNDVRKKIRKELNIEGKFVIGNVGRLHFQKNQKFLIDVFNEIIKRKKDAYLIIAGAGDEENELKEKANRLYISDKIIFLGQKENVNDYYNAMDVFVFPSLFEGLPLTLVEAQANGLNIYTSEEAIPYRTKMATNFKFIPLKDGAKEWANIILSDKSYNRTDNLEAIQRNGFDIKLESRKVEEEFLRI